ncbi:DDB1- and CUL4-associated factor homolog 1 [Striga asiatica]|uniref:DDB1-and CUL4-associated factor homolog 1 n=1 Tax=Striga asiatica TaxID=4170 RepID=A0A5A7Q5R9_STRAF|nr:DDB1- and CUL4-associated factor homolog 1 [Striga asiatica]
MEASTGAELEMQPEPSVTAAEVAEEGEDQQDDEENDILMATAQSLIDKITADSDNPSPKVLHALSTILETQESRYMEDADHSSTNNGSVDKFWFSFPVRCGLGCVSAHLLNKYSAANHFFLFLQDNDEFFELISSKFLTENRYSTTVQAAATRLLVSCSSTWTYPHVFDDDVLANIRGWVMEEIPRSSGEDRNWKHDTGKRKASDSEMLRSYATGLLAVCLACGGQLVEDVLTSGLSAKLMRFLRIRVLGDTNANQKDGNPFSDNRSASTTAIPKAKEECRGRLRPVVETSVLDAPNRDPAFLDNPDRDSDRCVSRQSYGDEYWADEEPTDCMVLEVDAHEAEEDGEQKTNIRVSGESKTKPSGKSQREEDVDENVRDESSRRRPIRGLSRFRGKGVSENELSLTSPGSGSRSGQARSGKDRRNQDPKKASDEKKGMSRINTDYFIHERDDNDDCFQDCKVGSKDITDLVKKAVKAAESEARAADAPVLAIRAAGDDAAEVVKTAALEEYNKTKDEEAAVLAASRAASTVIDAANAVALARNYRNADDISGNSKPTDPETSEDVLEFSIPDPPSLAKLREKFCIQCLVILGEYVEVLGPVLHEKGVDVCVALLLRSSKNREALNNLHLLPDILKVISALAAHRKFAALFVDRGGMQRLLAVPRNAETFFGLSACLFTIGSIQGIMERVCALPSNIVHQVVELALQLLACPLDYQARKNAALFFAAAFVFRAVIDAFDEQEGLQKLLSLLHDAASVRSGVPPGSSSNGGSLRNDRSPAEVLTSSEKQIAYHTCVALRQYFRAHLLLLVDSVRPTKNIRSAPRNNSRSGYKPLDLSNEALDAVFRQIQKDRKLGPALVRARWPVVDKFLGLNGHITMLELCQAPAVDRYLHDLLQYALGVLHIVTLVPYSRKPIVNATLSNDRVGIAVILDAANGAGYVEPEIVEPALNLLINLVCPPPSISNKPSQGQQFSSLTGNQVSERAPNVPSQNEPREREPASVDRGNSSAAISSSTGNASLQVSASTVTSGLVGDRRISLGGGAGCAGLAAQLEQGYHQAREAVRANNGIKILLQLLQPRMVTSPAALDCLRALTCRVLIGLARDDTIAHILTKLQVGKKLSELIRDSGSQTTGGEQNRWLTELIQVTIELIGVVTNSGRASTLAACDAATPTLRRIERAAIAAATPISYHSRELLLLIHEHLQASGLADSAAALLREAKLIPLPSLAAPSSLAHQASGQESSAVQIQWPSGRAPLGFWSDKPNIPPQQKDPSSSCDSIAMSAKKKPLSCSDAHGSSIAVPGIDDSSVPSISQTNLSSLKVSVPAEVLGTPSVSSFKSGGETDTQIRTPIVLPLKRKFNDSKESGPCSLAKRLNTSENALKSPGFATTSSIRRNNVQSDANLSSTPISASKGHNSWHAPNTDENPLTLQPTSAQPAFLSDSQPSGSERLTLDSLVVQYLKHQHRQCPAPITTLPPLSLLHPHVCPEPKRSLDAPSNVTARLSTREFRNMYGGIHGKRKDRQFVYSRFRPWRTCRDDNSSLFTCIAFLGDSSRIALGSHTGELRVFDSNNNTVLESFASHQSPLTLVQSHFSAENQFVLSSSSMDVRLWDASSISSGPKHSFDGIKAARFSNSGSKFAALRADSSRREILLYDVHTYQLDMTLTDASSNISGRGQAYSLVHFSPCDSRLLWNGVLWDHRSPDPIHRFDQFTDYGGGGFHPAGNEVIINSEVWDLRNFRLLRSVPSLDQTTITFNAGGDVIYAILRRNLEDVTSAFNGRRVKHPLFSAFRTVDSVNYSDIATIPVDRCVLDFATEPTDSFVGLVTMDDQDEMYSSARVYEIGRRKPTDDDSDQDDAESEEDDEEEGDEEDDDDDEDGDEILEEEMDGDDLSDDDDIASEFADGEEDVDFLVDDVDLDDGILEIVSEGDEDDEDDEVMESFSSEDEDDLF